MASPASSFVLSHLLAAIPRPAPTSVVQWAEENVRLVGSARSESYRADITPWTKEVIEDVNNGTRRSTLIKPIQGGGTGSGEIVILFGLSHFAGGDIQYNWPNDLQASDRWKKHMEKKLRACAPVMARLSDNRFDWTDGLIIFPHLNFIMQGIKTERSVTGDSIRLQVNEELHDGDNWIPGRLEQAYGRTTAFWNSFILNISNASHKRDQLHQAFLQGTQQHWMVRCPGCSNPHHQANWKFHVLRSRWDPTRPDLGGLRYDASGCRLEEGEVNYTKLLPTIHYHMPCGYKVHDSPSERRSLSLSGRYSEPVNKGAPLTERSRTLEAVSVDYIPWVNLIQQKHLALRARKLGDPKPWLNYLRERECQFIGVEDRRPEPVPIVLSARKKDREGLPHRRWRFGQLDYQVGRKEYNETPHFWLVIQDFDVAGNSLIVFEGKCESEGEVLDALRRHEVKPISTACDASFTGEDRYVYFFCLKYGFNAIKVHGGKTTFMHEDGVRRAWSEPEPLWPRAPGQEGPSKSNPDEEPEFWNISQSGAMDALAHLRARKDRTYEIPADVSKDFQDHFKPWSVEEYRIPATNQLELRWKKSSEKADDHMYQCCVYLALWAEMAGATSSDDIQPEQKETE